MHNFIRINGINIHYREYFQHKQETILFIHANVVDMRIFDTMISYLGAQYHIVQYDLRGYGMSDNDVNIDELTLDHFSDDLHQFIEHLQLDHIHLVGLQMGALIATRYTSRFSTNVGSLTLMTVPCHPPHLIQQVRAHRQKLANNYTSIPFDYIEQHATILDSGHPELMKLREYAKAIPYDLYKKVMDITVSSTPLADIRTINCPIIILTGSKEILFPAQYLQLHTIYLEHCSFRTISKASSLMVIDRPGYIANLLVEWLDELKRRDQPYDPFLARLGKEIYDYTSKQLGAYTFDENVLQVDILENFHVYMNGVEVSGGWNKRFAKSILLYLLFQRTASREQLCDTLWPNISLQQAKKNLRVYLSYLRQQLTLRQASFSFLVVERDEIKLQGKIKSDGLDFIERLHEAEIEKNDKQKEEKVIQFIENMPLRIFESHHDEWFHTFRSQVEQRIMILVHSHLKKVLENGYNQVALHLVEKINSVLPTFEWYEQLIDLYEKLDMHAHAHLWRTKLKNDMEEE
ncbi:alpha/beta hydrolase [Halalkalibacter hemicellulosilyticus]|uniref:3-oxoadipate enol-lactonase n=1 Tax=Halalkalibacter hemicellulosilyticusJCM 9152 TaxID=1236971 RepID=W4QKX1_9BACI|nr:alpha/beta hydrolase [Halalkalibacter hemicellulosilyticus]GAE32547.1 3-oxoadipate enol-lactonase [Halalkalibacter hemicellulosilyticusJCM 9152]